MGEGGGTGMPEHPTYLAIFGSFPFDTFEWVCGYLTAREYDGIIAAPEGGDMPIRTSYKQPFESFRTDPNLRKIVEGWLDKNFNISEEEKQETEVSPRVIRTRVLSLTETLTKIIPEIKSRWPDLQIAVYSPWPEILRDDIPF